MSFTAVPSLGGGRGKEVARMPESGGRVKISASTREVMESLADTIIPSGDPDWPGAFDVNLVDRLMDWLSEIPGAARAFVIVCWAWEYSPLQMGKPARFSRLGIEERIELLESFESSRMAVRRFALLGLKGLFMAAFYNNPEIWPRMGYDEGCYGDTLEKKD